MQRADSTPRAEILRPEDTPLTMSSREIAELTAKHSDQVVIAFPARPGEGGAK